MGKCLVSKYNGSATVSDYYLFNQLKITASNAKFGVRVGSTAPKYTVKSGQLLYNDGSPVTNNPYTAPGSYLQILKCTSSIVMFIDNKYDITEFMFVSTEDLLPYEDIKYCEKIQKLFLYSSPCNWSLNEIASFLNLTTLRVENTDVTGTIEEFASLQASSRDNGDTVDITCNGIITYNGATIANNTIKTITFDGQGGYVVS